MPPSVIETLQVAGIVGKQVGNSLLDLLLPPTCRLCDSPVEAGDFCRGCEHALTISEPMMQTACIRCGTPKPSVDRAGTGPSEAAGPNCEPGERVESPAAGRCVHCQRLSFGFDGVVPLWSYQDQVCQAVVTAKYAQKSPLADALGRRLADRVNARRDLSDLDLVTFVPSHLTRQFARGGNGNLTIAAAVSRRIRRPCKQMLKPCRRIAKQAWLDDRQRQENVRNAFRLKRSYALGVPEIADRHILLVDDVLTTGATANEVARVLREGGARCVTLAVVARALRS